jgi:hypothetical protein
VSLPRAVYWGIPPCLARDLAIALRGWATAFNGFVPSLPWAAKQRRMVAEYLAVCPEPQKTMEPSRGAAGQGTDLLSEPPEVSGCITALLT